MKKLTAILLIIVMLFSLAACGSESNGSNPSGSQSPASAQEPANAQTENETRDDTTVSDVPAEDRNTQNETETPSANNPPQDDNNSGTPATGDGMEQGSKILVAYFSRVGNTVWEDDVDAVTSASLNVIDGEFAGNAQLLAQMAQEATGGDLFLIQTVDTYPSDYRETTNVAADEQSDDARPALASHVDNMERYDTIVLVYPNWWGTLPQPLYTFLEEYDFSGKTILPLCTHEGSRMGSSERAIASICPDATLLEGLAVRGGSAASAQSDVETWINASGIFG